ncbi:membrane protein containing Signal transduction response regulator, receiver region domain protein [Candidatus Magnetomorum sp. HK-1]|nr:membrane protein containing Signal transduction response regulator, receiver region domain protein [Candidatus Magnetomorum sp. HK-1]
MKTDQLSIKKTFKHSIATRILFWIFIGFCVLGTIFISEYHDIYNQLLQTKNNQYLTILTNQMVQKKELIASKLLKQITFNIELFQYIEVFNLIDKLVDQDPSLLNAFLIDANGYVHHQKKTANELLSSTKKYEDIKTISSGLINSNVYIGDNQTYLVCMVPITIQTEDWGKLKLVYLLDSINNEKKRLHEQQNFLIFSNLIWIFGVWVSCLISLGIAIYIILSRHSKRLVQMGEEIDTIEHKQTNVYKTLSCRSDETGYLASKIQQNYNQMFQKLTTFQSRYNQLHETYKDSDQINERTRKLLHDAQSGIKEWEQQYKITFNTCQEALLFLSLKGKILEVNQSFLNMTGYQQKDILNIDLTTFIPKDWNVPFKQTILRKILNDIEPEPQEIVIRRKDNTFLFLSITGHLCHNPYSEPHKILLSGINISLQKHAQLMFKDLDFLIQHDLKDALGRIIGLSELMTAKTQVGKKDLVEWSGIIHQNARKMLDMVQQELSFFKIESNRFELQCRECNLIKIFQKLETDLSLIMISKSIEIQYHLDKTPISWDHTFDIWADCNLLTLMFNRLLVNILNISPENQKIYISLIKNHEINIIIHSEVKLTKEMVNEFFSRPLNDSKQKNGAYIALLIAKAHGGSIGIQSNTHTGSEFILMLPNKSSSISQDLRKKPLNILVADDSQNNQIIIDFYLTDNTSWTNDAANNGQEALAFYKKNAYDLILMDIEMPVMNGISAIKAIRKFEQEKELEGKKCPKIYIIALSADTSIEAQNQAIQAGADDFMNKPVEQETLIKTILKSQK